MPSIAQQDNLRLEAKSGTGASDYGLQLQLLNAIERKTIFDVIYTIKAESPPSGTITNISWEDAQKHIGISVYIGE